LYSIFLPFEIFAKSLLFSRFDQKLGSPQFEYKVVIAKATAFNLLATDLHVVDFTLKLTMEHIILGDSIFMTLLLGLEALGNRGNYINHQKEIIPIWISYFISIHMASSAHLLCLVFSQHALAHNLLYKDTALK
jgi:hypothetical protein